MAIDPVSDKPRRAAGVMSLLETAREEWRPARDLPVQQERLWLAGLLFVAAILRFATMTQDSIWIDEGYTLASAGQSFALLFTVPFDSHPSLHFVVVKIAAMFLEGEAAVRFPSALFSTVMLVPTYLLMRRLIGPVGALVGTSILALSFTMLVYANNGRNYAQLLMLIMFAAWALQALAERFALGKALLARETFAWGAIYTVSAIAALYSHNTAILYLFVLNAVFCGWVLVTAPRSAFGFTWKLAAVNAPAILVWLPWLTVMVGTSGAFDWLAQKSPVEAAVTLAGAIGPNNVPAIIMLGSFLAMLAGGLLSLVRPGWSLAVIIAHVAAFPLFIWLMGYAFKPVYMERIILPAAVGGALAIGYLAAHGRRRWLTAGLTGLALTASAWSAAAYTFRGDSYGNLGGHLIQDWRPAVAAHDTPGNALLICDTFTWPTVDLYRTSAEVWVHDQTGAWDLKPEFWRSNYGVPISGDNAVARHRYSAWMDEAIIPWDEAVKLAPRIVFMKPDVLCNDGEPELIAQRLTASGYSLTRSDQWRGVRADVWER
ncbi:MAG: glycosyltransferase family 39 protein [Pseudomonadota bacterium]